MFDYAKILDALKVIKETCELAGDCNKCPLSNVDEKCWVSEEFDSPNDWGLVDLEEPQVIRLIK